MKITKREKEIILLVADELTTKEIAARLYISNETVTTHRRNLMDKLEAKNAAGLVRRGFENGLLRIAMMIILTLQLPSIIVGQEQSIGLEIDSAHSVLFGVPLDSMGNSFYWSPDKGTLIAGTDDGMGFPIAGKYDLDSIGAYSAVFGLGNKIHGSGSLGSGSANEIGNFAIFSAISGTQNKIVTNGAGSNVWGVGNIAHASISTIWGSGNRINEDATLSTSWGNFNIVNAANSTAWGLDNIANKNFSTVFGRNNKANGIGSTVIGQGNISQVDNGLVIGSFNDTIQGLLGHPVAFESLPLFVVGNGTGVGGGNARSNAISVFGSGFVKLGDGLAAADLHIKQSESAIHGLTGGIRLEATFSNDYWQVYNSGTNFSFGKNGTRRAYISPEGQYIDDENFHSEKQPLTKSFSSSRNDILSVNVGLTSHAKRKNKVKVDAAQILNNFPDMIVYDEDGQPFGIDYRQLYLTAIVALQEEIKVNKQQQKEIDTLKAVILK